MGNKLTIFQITVCETVVINARGGIYFINHKTNGYLPEGVGLLNIKWHYEEPLLDIFI